MVAINEKQNLTQENNKIISHIEKNIDFYKKFNIKNCQNKEDLYKLIDNYNNMGNCLEALIKNILNEKRI